MSSLTAELSVTTELLDRGEGREPLLAYEVRQRSGKVLHAGTVDPELDDESEVRSGCS